LLVAGLLVTFVSTMTALVLMMTVYKQTLLSMMGSLSAAMTNPPALEAAQAQAETDLPTVAYASVYPVALIFKILLAQLLVEVLSKFLT
jgi:putative transport protein